MQDGPKTPEEVGCLVEDKRKKQHHTSGFHVLNDVLLTTLVVKACCSVFYFLIFSAFPAIGCHHVVVSRLNNEEPKTPVL